MAEWEGRLARLAQAYGSFLEAASRLSPEARGRTGACGDWTPHDVVAHSTGWELEAVARLRAIRADPALPGVTYDVDAFNAASVAARRRMGWDATLDELRRAHAELEALLATVSQEAEAGDERFAEWVTGRAEDFEHHAGQLRAWEMGA